jgi:hypothetical protein
VSDDFSISFPYVQHRVISGTKDFACGKGEAAEACVSVADLYLLFYER